MVNVWKIMSRRLNLFWNNVIPINCQSNSKPSVTNKATEKPIINFTQRLLSSHISEFDFYKNIINKKLKILKYICYHCRYWKNRL